MTSGPEGSAKWRVLAAVGAGAFLSTLNITIVNVALPTIAGDFSVSIDEVQLVVLGYLLPLGTLLLAFGRLGDIVGYRRIYLSGLALFALSSVLCGLSDGVWELSGWRVLQGVGSGMVQAVGPAILVGTFAPGERGKAQGLFAVSIALGIALGPTSGALLTGWASWSWVFFVSAPLAAFAALYSWRVLPEQRPGSGERFDAPGALLLFGAASALLLAVLGGDERGWTSPDILGLLAASGVLGAAFAAVEARVRQPLLDIRLLRIRPFWAGNASVLIAFSTLFTATFLIPFYLQDVKGLSILETGLFMTPLPLATLLVSPFGGALSDRIGTRVLTTTGISLVGLGLLSLTAVDAGTGAWGLTWRLSVTGAGLGLFVGPNQSQVLGAVPVNRLGMTSGAVAQMRNTGQAFGVALAGAVVAATLPGHVRELAQNLPREAAEQGAFVLSMHDAFYAGAAVCVLGILTSLLSERTRTTLASREAARSASTDGARNAE